MKTPEGWRHEYPLWAEEKNIYNNEIEVYVYCGALDVGNTSSQNYEEMSKIWQTTK